MFCYNYLVITTNEHVSRNSRIMDCSECYRGMPMHIMLMRKCFLAMLMLMPVILMLLNLNTDYANADVEFCPYVVILNMIWQTQCLPSYYNLLQWWTSGMILEQCLKRETEISLACSKLTYNYLSCWKYVHKQSLPMSPFLSFLSRIFPWYAA